MRRAAFLFPAALAVPACAHAAAAPDYASVAAGRTQAILADCEGCHTAPGGKPLAGGLVLQTPFGRLAAPNITPDDGTGIGAWTKEEFRRAVKSGMAPAGRRLYPAMPYPYYARISDAEVDGLWAYLQTVAPVRHRVRANLLPFPFNIRALMAGWNALFHKPGALQPDPAKSGIWNRGAYLVEGLGHCSACHSPRNALGAEVAGAHLAGGSAEGWEAPALTSLSQAPIPWSEDELYAYLRTGESRLHGVAAGPMAPVVKELAALPDSDIRAMAVYLASFNDKAMDQAAQQALAARLESSTGTRTSAASSVGARIYQGACAVCHEVGGAPLFGSRPSLALNSNLHSAVPDNLIQVILHGIAKPAVTDLGYMPAFKDSLTDGQVAELAAYLRHQFAPDKPAWTDIDAALRRIRQE
jgi:nicotinate dehydrogenase subunit B